MIFSTMITILDHFSIDMSLICSSSLPTGPYYITRILLKLITLWYRSPRICDLTAGQLAVLRKYSLLKLTALMERHTQSHRGMWNW